jgi:hypothetical protein
MTSTVDARSVLNSPGLNRLSGVSGGKGLSPIKHMSSGRKSAASKSDLALSGAN